MNPDHKTQWNTELSGLNLKKLSIRTICQLDDLLSSVGEYGEVTLVVEHGILKYINKTESLKAQTDKATEEK